MWPMADLQDQLDKGIRGKRAEIAEACRISPQAVYQWKKVPAAHVLTVEEITGIPRHELRPDIFGEGESPRAKAKRRVA